MNKAEAPLPDARRQLQMDCQAMLEAINLRKEGGATREELAPHVLLLSERKDAFRSLISGAFEQPLVNLYHHHHHYHTTTTVALTLSPSFLPLSLAHVRHHLRTWYPWTRATCMRCMMRWAATNGVSISAGQGRYYAPCHCDVMVIYCMVHGARRHLVLIAQVLTP
jgi:hypothetical protein